MLYPLSWATFLLPPHLIPLLLDLLLPPLLPLLLLPLLLLPLPFLLLLLLLLHLLLGLTADDELLLCWLLGANKLGCCVIVLWTLHWLPAVAVELECLADVVLWTLHWLLSGTSELDWLGDLTSLVNILHIL